VLGRPTPGLRSGARVTPPVSGGEETLRLLSKVEVFADLDPRELEELGRVAVPRSYERGEVIFREGDGGDTCFVIRTGAVVLSRGHDDGREVALAELRGGAMFGELALFGGERRSATAQAVEPTEAVALLGSDVERLVRSHPDMALAMLSSMAARVRRTNERLLSQSFQTVPGRVAGAVLSQVVARQAEGAPEQDVLVKATQAEIASLAGTSRESASRFLATLEREGVVSLGRGKVTVHEPARLRNFIH
jgi:CRP/FNR family transcriptional regulator, cyclic AMP receptor protein